MTEEMLIYLKKQQLIDVVKTRVKGMESENADRVQLNMSMAYTSADFNEAADEIENIINQNI